MEDTATDLGQLTVRDLLDRLASRAPVPGGGSAAALSGALGAALVAMVEQLSSGRQDAVHHAAELRDIGRAARGLIDTLVDLANEDAAAYQAVVDARRLPRDSEEAAARRREAMEQAVHAAAESPLRVARAAGDVLELARRVAPVGNPNAVSDAGVAALLAAAAVRAAALNVRINLPYLGGADELRRRAPEELAELERRVTEMERTTSAAVAARMPA